MEFKLMRHPLYNSFTQRAFTRISVGGADFGECLVTIKRIEESNNEDEASTWHQEWSSTANKLFEIAKECQYKKHFISAKESYLRACTYYQTSYFPLFGFPLDPRLQENFEKETQSFQKAIALDPESTIETVEIPFEKACLPAYFVKVDKTNAPRPTVIYTNGYDGNIQEMFFNHAPAAIKRGYHCLLFDGPGQGRNLIRDNQPLRPDWENVVKAVVDYAIQRPEIDSNKLILAGWSFGGFLAPRAAAFEHRLAALVVDPGQWDQKDLIAHVFNFSEEEKRQFPYLNSQKLQQLQHWLYHEAPLAIRWRLVKRSFWLHQTPSLKDYFEAISAYEISNVAHQIQCPTLIAMPQGDITAKSAPLLYEAIKAKKTLVHFTEEEGSGGHCEALGRMLYHQRVYDWLDELFM